MNEDRIKDRSILDEPKPDRPKSDRPIEEELELYIHVPFCVRKCAYCDFLSFPADESVRERYVSALTAEIRQAGRSIRQQRSAGEAGKLPSQKVVSIFLGGGTPSILTAGQIGRILEAVWQSFPVSDSAEITMECNPGTADEEKLSGFVSAGINRLSIGLQSAHDSELRMLGRIHTFSEFLSIYQQARDAGFANVSIDLMSGLPGQSIAGWADSLQRVVSLQPEHISAYGLIIEEGTPFYARYHEDDLRREKGENTLYLPDEDTEREIYHLTGQYLADRGYQRYEISNYARPGYESVHNTGYWLRRDYLGFGLGASSLYQHERWKNTDDLKTYLADAGTGLLKKMDWIRLDEQDEREETMFLGLRMVNGVSVSSFVSRFGVDPRQLYHEQLAALTGQGLIEVTGQPDVRIRLTEMGIDVSNYVMTQFIL